MTLARFLGPVVVLAVLSACSGNLGGGQSTLPGGPQPGSNVQQLQPPVATATPVSASNVATFGADAAEPQALPTVLGWGGSITFPKPAPVPSGSPNAKGSPAPSASSAANSVAIGITGSVVEPSEAPHLNPAWSKRRTKPSGPNGLFFVTLLATSDVTLAAYPKIAFDVPRDIMAQHRSDTFALALFDPEQSEKAYKLAVAERDLSSPLPMAVSPTPVPTPSTTPTGVPGLGNGSGMLTPPPVGSGLGSAGSLPPQRIAFAGTEAALNLKANRPLVFALYALAPTPTPTPSPTPHPSATGSAHPSPLPSGSPGTATSAQPAAAPASPQPSPTPSGHQ